VSNPESLTGAIRLAATAAANIKECTIGPDPFLPEYPYHRALRRCPFCGSVYRRHSGFADHRDNCREGPNPGANPVRVSGGDES